VDWLVEEVRPKTDKNFKEQLWRQILLHHRPETVLQLSVRIVVPHKQVNNSIDHEYGIKVDEKGHRLLSHHLVQTDIVGREEDPNDEHELEAIVPLVQLVIIGVDNESTWLVLVHLFLVLILSFYFVEDLATLDQSQNFFPAEDVHHGYELDLTLDQAP